MRKADLKRLYEKLMEFIGKKLIYLNQVEEWTDVELAAKLGVPAPRLTEIKGYSKYKRLMSENTLVAIIGGGIVTIDDLKKNVELNEEEAKYVDSLSLVQDKRIRTALQTLKDRGVDLYEALDKLVEETKE